MRNNYFFLFFVLISQAVFSQNKEKLFHGKVFADGNNVEGINVVNLVNEKSAVTNQDGDFYILAKEDDLIVLSSLNFEYKRKIIAKEDLDSRVVTINMVPKTTQLDEVVITEYKNINAVDLGILSRPAKVYTPAERKLKTATDLNFGIGLGVIFSIDPLINAMSGRTKKLKNELKVERKERLLKQLQDLYEEDYFVTSLKIPSDNVKGFQYFAIEDKEFTESLKSKNKSITKLLLGQLAQKYIQYLSDEK